VASHSGWRPRCGHIAFFGIFTTKPTIEARTDAVNEQRHLSSQGSRINSNQVLRKRTVGPHHYEMVVGSGMNVVNYPNPNPKPAFKSGSQDDRVCPLQSCALPADYVSKASEHSNTKTLIAQRRGDSTSPQSDLPTPLPTPPRSPTDCPTQPFLSY
jgi:hypothetical protein